MACSPVPRSHSGYEPEILLDAARRRAPTSPRTRTRARNGIAFFVFSSWAAGPKTPRSDRVLMGNWTKRLLTSALACVAGATLACGCKACHETRSHESHADASAVVDPASSALAPDTVDAGVPVAASDDAVEPIRIAVRLKSVPAGDTRDVILDIDALGLHEPLLKHKLP